MPQPTQEQLELTGAIVERVNTVDWDGDITPYIDELVQAVESLLAMDPERIDFVTEIRYQAVRWSMAAWGEELVANLSDSGWSKLSDRLKLFENEEN